MADRAEAAPPKRGIIGTLAAAVSELAQGIDAAANSETNLGRKLRTGAVRAAAIDEIVRETKDKYDRSATKQLVELAKDHHKKVIADRMAKNDAQRSSLVERRFTMKGPALKRWPNDCVVVSATDGVFVNGAIAEKGVHIRAGDSVEYRPSIPSAHGQLVVLESKR